MSESFLPNRPRRTLQQRLVLGNVFLAFLLLFTVGITIWQADRLAQAVSVFCAASCGQMARGTEREEAAARQVASAKRAVILYPALGIALSLLGGGWLAWRTRRGITQPVERLAHAAARVTAGHLDGRIAIESQDELGQLAVAFNLMADQLQTARTELEQRVAERTTDLQRRAVQLQTAAEVARDAVAARAGPAQVGLSDLLNRAVNLVQERFGFYHAGIFIVDEWGEYAVLRAATGEAGRQMLERGHSLRVGEVGIVGYVTHTGCPRIALDVGADAVYFQNPLLPDTRSELALPLKVGERIIGALDVQSQEPNAFDENDVTVLQTVADQLAMAIENVRLLHEMQQTMRELTQERNMFGATLDALPDILFEVDRHGRIHDFRAPRPHWIYFPTLALVGQSVDQIFPPEAANIILEALRQAAESGRHAGAVYRLETSAGPNWFELSIASKGDTRASDGRFMVLARDVTGRVRAEETLRQRNRDLSLLNRLGQELTAMLDPQQVIEQLLRAGTEVVGAEDASVWLWDKDQRGYLVCQTILHRGQKRSPLNLRVAPGQGVIGRVAQTGQSTIASYAPEDPRFFPGIDEQTGFRTTSLLAAPLRVQSEVIGVLEVVNKLSGNLDEDDLVLAETLAASAAIALDNAALVERLRQHADQLQARNEELDAFAHTVAHDLKGSLGHMVGYASVLEEDYATLPGEALRRYLHTIAQSGRKMSNVIDALLLLASVRQVEEVELVPLEMASVVAESISRLSYMIEEYQAEIVLPAAWPVAQGYGPWIEEVWINYVSNAIKYGGRPPRVELGAILLPPPTPQAGPLPISPLLAGEGEGEGMVRFWARDNGPGLTPEEQASLFVPFSRLDEVHAKGYGLGLSIVRRIIERLGGQVGLESESRVGSTFWFTLPA